jgi:hypothetical protein
MPVIADLVPRVRRSLGVNATYDDDIAAGIGRAMVRLLRDYNFPKTVRRLEYADLAAGVQQFQLPDGFKRPLQVQFYEPAASAWSEPLMRREGFVRPSLGLHDDRAALPYASYYWLEGSKLWTDRPLDAGAAGITLQLFYQSMLVDDDNTSWMLQDFEDIIFTYSVVRLAPDLRKPEVLAAYAPLWQDEQQSIAIFLNELEFAGLDMQMREPLDNSGYSRYPR